LYQGTRGTAFCASLIVIIVITFAHTSFEPNAHTTASRRMTTTADSWSSTTRKVN
jgi:hypothetical protein